ncbi:acyl-CoA N-acyltransferase [Plenodomus tracheiphilus IPT5]|uniref:Acyl-CoA N-acyltransferase n=1 Tax=Plenodomus tracheiphilus IPT5 TaxID=1408161 RepID=A0A6A7B6V3_9PLEO|nr:acyl-CoA N-acyltransferase [Plenodomus tracheiphilus IPT5]
MQSSLNNWLKKPSGQQNGQLTSPPPPPLSNPKRPPPPPKASSAPNRVPSATVPGMSNMDNWNDIPDDFLQAPSRPRAKKSPRSSRAVTPATLSRVPSPVALPVQQPSIPQLFALRPLPDNVQLVPLTEEHLPAYKQLNALTLPIPYPESFYKETMTEPHLGVTLVALWHASPTWGSISSSEKPQLVGAIRCRILPDSQLYISTIGILAPYRSHGIAMHLLQTIVKKAVDLHQVRCVTAHVWEANEEGLEWYKKRNFETLGKEEGYYRKLRPHGAFLVKKWIGIGDLLANGAVEGKQVDGHVEKESL